MTFPHGIRSGAGAAGVPPAAGDGGAPIEPYPGFPRAPGAWPGTWTVLALAETTSTNADLLALAAPGGPAHGQDRIALVAAHQTAGRGRLGRHWEAPAGANLLVSLLVRVDPEGDDARAPHRITQRVALAAALACDRLAPPGVPLPTLKWPNDLLLEGRKLAGVLAEAGARLDHVVVGLGLNLVWAPEGAVSLGSAWAGAVPTRDDLLAAILGIHDELAADPAALHAAYRARLGTLGQEVRVDLPDGTEITGRALEVEIDGRLVVLDACGITHRVSAGDVVHLRPT